MATKTDTDLSPYERVKQAQEPLRSKLAEKDRKRGTNRNQYLLLDRMFITSRTNQNRGIVGHDPKPKDPMVLIGTRKGQVIMVARAYLIENWRQKTERRIANSANAKRKRLRHEASKRRSIERNRAPRRRRKCRG